MFKVILLRMKYVGCNPFNNAFYQIYFARTLIIFKLITIASQSYFLSKYKENYKDISTCVLDMLGTSALWQINYKIYTMHIKKDLLLSLYNTMQTKFWPLDDTFTPRQFNNIQKLFKITKFVTKIYSISLYCTLYGFCFTSPFKNDHHIINNIWMPDYIARNYIYLNIILIIQFIAYSLSTVGGLMTFDQAFLLGIVNGMAQLKLLKYKLRSVGSVARTPNGDYHAIIECVNHHNMLFEFLNYIEQFASFGVLHMLGTNMVSGVVILLAFLVEDNISQLIIYVAIMISVAGQFYMYCLLGQFIQTETESVADAAYAASWEDIPDRRVKMGIFLIIQRSQKYAIISMGGFLILCLENFTRAARMVLSMLTLILNMRNE